VTVRIQRGDFEIHAEIARSRDRVLADDERRRVA